MSLADNLIAPSAVRTNNNTGLIKWIAFLSMLCDHFGKMVFPQVPALRLIGRLAFPLFGYCIAVGAACTRNPARYLERVVLLVLVSQPLYALGLAHENAAMYSVPFPQNPVLSAWNFYVQSWQKPSILLTLALSLSILLAFRQRRFILAAGLYILCERFASSLDYGINGVRFILLCYPLLQYPVLYALCVTSFWYAWSRDGSGYVLFGQSFAMRVYALPAVLFTALPLKKRLSLPKWFSYGFYPAHLLLLALLSHPQWLHR